MIIDVTGFGWSGSGAVHDLLREYDDIKFASFDKDWEFTLLWTTDGIYDLEHKLCYKHCRFGDSSNAIKRFLDLTEAQNRTPFLFYDKIFDGRYYDICKHYIDDLIQLSFEGRTFEELMFPSKKEKLLGPYYNIVRRLFGNRIAIRVLKKDYSQQIIKQRKHLIRVSYNPDNFEERTHQFMDEIFSYVRTDRNVPLVTDQLFPPDCPTMFFKYVGEPVKCIVVRRDPRDTYLLAKKAYNSNIPLPVENVQDFITFYKKTIEETRVSESDQLLNIQFEDLIFHYERTIARIEHFLNISQHSRPKSKFNPAVSVNNTRLFNKYEGFEEDIRKIEDALQDSLYPYETAPIVEAIQGKVF